MYGSGRHTDEHHGVCLQVGWLPGVASTKGEGTREVYADLGEWRGRCSPVRGK